MIRRIIVPLDPSAHADAAVSYAIQLAQAHDAEVTGFMVVDTPGIHDSVSPISPGAAVYAKKAENRLEAEAHERIRSTLEKFASRCDEAGVSHKEIEDQGDPVEAIARVSAFYDLLIVGLRTHFHFQTTEGEGDTLQDLIGRLATPILAVTEEHIPLSEHLEVVVAFDGSPAAIRSLRQFTQLAAFSNPNIAVLTANEELEAAKQIFGPAEEYLRAYGYTDIDSEWTPMHIADAIDEEFIDKADLIVLGMHAKHGIFSFVVGSLANHMIRMAKVPVFIGQ
ncbi:MAG: universal stress protein [Rhodothermales bacterium]|jgi:nucleotide-binding universal stress UspA family protein